MTHNSKEAVLYLIIALLLPLLLLKTASAAAGAYCESGNLCTCGSQCVGGYEFANLYNTIDGCPDGPDFNYEDVENITAKALNATLFRSGKTIEITVNLKSTIGDPYTIFYNNGSGFYPILNGVCNVTGNQVIMVNKTLDWVSGNHTIRAFIYYPEGANNEGQTCAYSINNYYSDTDDIKFKVGIGDTAAPVIQDFGPQGTTYLLENQVLVAANITDDDLVKEAHTNITDPLGITSEIQMSRSGNSTLGTYSQTGIVGRYNYTIYAKDDTGNMANASGYFLVDYTINITVQSPADGRYYNTTWVNFNMSIIDANYTTDMVLYELNGAPNQSLLPISENFNGTILGERNTTIANLSQSFNSSINLQVQKLLLAIRKTGEGTNYLYLRNDSNGPGGVLAYAVLNESIGTSSAFYPVILNQSVNILTNRKYWITIMNGTGNSSVFWSFGENYSRGESGDNASNDYLFYVLDKEKYRGNFSIASSNTLKIFANNSAGVIKTKEIAYYYDITPPSFLSVSALDTLEYGDPQFFRVTLSDAFPISECLIELFGANYTMSREGPFLFNYSYIPDQGPMNYRFYFNDSAGLRNSSGTFSFFVNDSAPPAVHSVGQYPNVSADVDPNATIGIYVNATDASLLDNVTLYYGESPDTPEWKSMYALPSGIYYANFTPVNSTTYYYKIFVLDDFGNSNTTQTYSTNVSFDYSFGTTPGHLGIFGSLIGKNVSVGNFTINNTGDYAISVNFYKSESTTPQIYYSENPAVIPAHSTKRINLTALAPDIEAEYPIRIYANTSFQTEEVNSTLFVRRGGAYLVAEFITYPQSVTIGSRKNNITFRIINIGNETASGVYYNFSLPSGWTSRENLSESIGTMIAGAERSATIYADISDAVITGAKTISLFTNSTSATSYFLSKNVDVIGIATPAAPAAAPSTQSSAGIVTAPRISGGAGKPTFGDEDSFNVSIGQVTRHEINITNFNRYIVWRDLRIEVEGFAQNKLGISDDGLGEIGYRVTKRFWLDFDVPQYTEEGKNTLNIKIIATQYDEKQNLTSEVTFRKSVRLAIHQAGKKSFCTDIAAEDIKELESAGAGIEKLKARLKRANDLIGKEDFDGAREICMEIKEAKESAETAIGKVKLIEEEVRRLEAGYFDVTRAKTALERANNLILQGDFAGAERAADEATYLLRSEEEANLASPTRIGRNILINHPLAFVIGVMASTILLTFGYSKGIVIQRKLRKSNYLRRERKVYELIKRAQKEHFEDRVIGPELYKNHMREYEKELARVMSGQMKIRLAEALGRKASDDERKKFYEDALAKVQEGFYIRHEIGEFQYARMNELISEKLAEIDERRSEK